MKWILILIATALVAVVSFALYRDFTNPVFVLSFTGALGTMLWKLFGSSLHKLTPAERAEIERKNREGDTGNQHR